MKYDAVKKNYIPIAIVPIALLICLLSSSIQFTSAYNTQ